MFAFKPYGTINNIRISFLSEEDHDRLLDNNGYFRYILAHGAGFCLFLRCRDITPLLKQYGYKAYNHKTYWESKQIPFEKALMIFLLSKIEPFASTVGNIGDHYVREEEWVVTMYQKNFIQLAFHHAQST